MSRFFNEPGKKMPKIVFCAAAVVAFALSNGCGSAKPVEKKPEKKSFTINEENEMREPPNPCRTPIAGPNEVWKRVDEVRSLSETERSEKCDLELVEIFSFWSALPTDLMEPIVSKAAEDQALFEKWIVERISSHPEAAVQVVAMEIVGGWKPGDESSSIKKASRRWSSFLKEKGLEGDPGAAGILKAVDEASTLAPLLDDITEIHKLRCMIEVNPIAFAVGCKPINRQGKKISISWQTVTVDGLIQELKIESCSGKSCSKLRRTAKKLARAYGKVLAKVEKLEVVVFRNALIELLKLPEFKSLPDVVEM